MEREIEGEQKYSGEQKNFDKADTKSQKSTKKRANNRTQQQTEFYKVFISFLLTAHTKRKKESRAKAEEYTYIISNERQKRRERASEANKAHGRRRGSEAERERGLRIIFIYCLIIAAA